MTDEEYEALVTEGIRLLSIALLQGRHSGECSGAQRNKCCDCWKATVKQARAELKNRGKK